MTVPIFTVYEATIRQDNGQLRGFWIDAHEDDSRNERDQGKSAQVK